MNVGSFGGLLDQNLTSLGSVITRYHRRNPCGPKTISRVQPVELTHVMFCSEHLGILRAFLMRFPYSIVCGKDT